MSVGATVPAAPVAAREGFSLVEVLVAIVILAVGIVAMASVSSPIRQLQLQSEMRIEMTHIAQSKLEEIRALGEGKQFGTDLALGGSLDESLADYSETAEGQGIRTYAVRWLIADGPSSTFLVTLRVIPLAATKYDPAPMDFQTLVMDR